MKPIVRRLAAIALVLIIAATANWWREREAGIAGPTATTGDIAVVADAYANHRSDVWVTVEGAVTRTLADDQEGSRHQRFIIELDGGPSLLVAHNIDLAERVPLTAGDTVTVRGEYEWNDRGGVLHWTHHDPQGRRDGGWIQHLGATYR